MSHDKSKIAKQVPNIVTGIGPMTDKVLNSVIGNLSDGPIKDVMVSKLFKPLLDDVNQKLKPYIYFHIGMYLFTVILLVVIIILIALK